jgi:hypothetical protein
MLSKCANPSCSAIFRYLREGTIFHVAAGPTHTKKNSIAGTSRHERFWLCGECSPKMTVISDNSGIRVVPLQDLSEKQRQQRARGMAVGAVPEPSS